MTDYSLENESKIIFWNNNIDEYTEFWFKEIWNIFKEYFEILLQSTFSHFWNYKTHLASFPRILYSVISSVSKVW